MCGQVVGQRDVVIVELKHDAFFDDLGEFERERVLALTRLDVAFIELGHGEALRDDRLGREVHLAHFTELVARCLRHKVRSLNATDSHGECLGLERLLQEYLDFSRDWITQGERSGGVVEHNDHASESDGLQVRAENRSRLLSGLLVRELHRVSHAIGC